MRRREFIIGFGLVLVGFSARAETYISDEAAARLIFPQADKFEPFSRPLTKAEVKQIKKDSRMRVREKTAKGFIARRGDEVLGRVYIDDVIGKHEFITYAAGISAASVVTGIEIMEYRETWGFEIKDTAWRLQFRGKSLRDPVKLGDDIQNISGATLSCRNVTDGVRRLLATDHVINL